MINSGSETESLLQVDSSRCTQAARDKLEQCCSPSLQETWGGEAGSREEVEILPSHLDAPGRSWMREFCFHPVRLGAGS